MTTSVKNSRVSVMYLAISMLTVSLISATFLRNNDWQDGVNLWEQVTRSGYQKARGYYILGVLYQNHDRLAEAIESYTKAITIDPAHVRAYTNRGGAYDDMGRPYQALEDFHTALRIAPSDDYLYYNIGETYRRMGRTNEAVLNFQKSCNLGNTAACSDLEIIMTIRSIVPAYRKTR